MPETEKRTAKRQAITEAAARVFSERGYAQTRMADVAEALGMQAGSLYYYFESKEALLAAAVADRVGTAADALERVVALDETPEAKIRLAIESHLVVFDEHVDLYTVFQSEHLEAVVPDLAAAVDEQGRRYEALWVRLVEEGVASGDLRPADPWLTMKAIVGLCNSTLFWYEHGGGLTLEGLAGRFADLVLDGLMA